LFGLVVRLLPALIFSPRRLFLLQCIIVLAPFFTNDSNRFDPPSLPPAAWPSAAALVFSLIFTRPPTAFVAPQHAASTIAFRVDRGAKCTAGRHRAE
jgi:hypothetical protein